MRHGFGWPMNLIVAHKCFHAGEGAEEPIVRATPATGRRSTSRYCSLCAHVWSVNGISWQGSPRRTDWYAAALELEVHARCHPCSASRMESVQTPLGQRAQQRQAHCKAQPCDGVKHCTSVQSAIGRSLGGRLRKG